jgi:hypothetical protein
MEGQRERSLRAWTIVIGVLLILSLVGVGIVMAIQQVLQTAADTVRPVNDMTSNLGTRVAEVLNPTPTVLPDPVTIIRGVRSLSRLETIQYSIEKVITAETGQGTFGFLFGDRLIFVAHGVVIAGVDLSKLDSADVWVENGVLYMRLPAPEVFVATLDNEKSYVYNRDTGALTHGDVNLETTARRAAEDEIRKAALEDGILQQAGQNAESYLIRLLLELGYPEVIFMEATPAPEPTPSPAP